MKLIRASDSSCPQCSTCSAPYPWKLRHTRCVLRAWNTSNYHRTHEIVRYGKRARKQPTRRGRVAFIDSVRGGQPLLCSTVSSSWIFPFCVRWHGADCGAIAPWKMCVCVRVFFGRFTKVSCWSLYWINCYLYTRKSLSGSQCSSHRFS